MNGAAELRLEIKALRARISRLGAANLPISASPDLRTVPHKALEGARGLTAALSPPCAASQPLRHADLNACARALGFVSDPILPRSFRANATPPPRRSPYELRSGTAAASSEMTPTIRSTSLPFVASASTCAGQPVLERRCP